MFEQHEKRIQNKTQETGLAQFFQENIPLINSHELPSLFYIFLGTDSCIKKQPKERNKRGNPQTQHPRPTKAKQTRQNSQLNIHITRTELTDYSIHLNSTLGVKMFNKLIPFKCIKTILMTTHD